MEGAHDAPNRTKKADKGGRVGAGGQHRKRALQAGQFCAHALTQRAAHVVDYHFAAVAKLFGAVELKHALMRNVVQRRSWVRAQRLHCFAQVGRFFKAFCAAQGFFVGSAQTDELLDHQPPAPDGHNDQKRQHRLGHQACLGDH